MIHSMNRTVLVYEEEVRQIGGDKAFKSRFVSCTCGWNTFFILLGDPLRETSAWAAHVRRQIR